MEIGEHYNRLITDSLKGELDVERQAELDKWLKVPQNRHYYDTVSKNWVLVQRRASSYNPDGDDLWRRFEERVLSDGGRKRKQRMSFMFSALKYAAVVAVTLVSSLFAYSYYYNATAISETGVNTFSSVEGRSCVVLSDGTVVWLRKGATIVCEFDKEQRRVALSGDAHFDVAKDSERLFVVNSNGLDINVYGTVFSVRDENHSNITMVTLESGSVRLVTATGQSHLLSPSHRAVYDRQTQSLSIDEHDAQSESCWIHNSLNFNNNNIFEVGESLSRWYDLDIEIDPEISKEYSYTFTLSGEPIEDILRLMTKVHPLDYVIKGDKIEIINKI